MILTALVIVVGMAAAALYVHMRRQPNYRSLWRTTLLIGVVVGLTRAALASFGWYVAERGGPLELPGFALAMMAWPEAAALAGGESRTTPMPADFFIRLSLLLVASTLLFASAVALVTTLLQLSVSRQPRE